LAKVNIKGLEKVTANISKLFNDVKKNPTLLKEIGDFILDRIRAFSRGGKSIVTNRKFKRLSDSYIAMRQGAVTFRKNKDGKTYGIQDADPRLQEVDSEYFEPSLSNVTFTGQMLRALKYVIDQGNGLVTIFVNNDSRKDGLTNSQVAKYVKDGGREFLGLDEKGVKRVKAMIISDLRKSIRKR
jgi:hypothetical protein